MDRGYAELIAAGAASLAPNERWCIDHDEGPLLETASVDLTAPVRIICEATGQEWDDLQESGFRIGRCTIEATP